MFSHFTYLYAQSKDRIDTHYYNYFETLSLQDVVNIYCQEPDESEFGAYCYHYPVLSLPSLSLSLSLSLAQ